MNKRTLENSVVAGIRALRPYQPGKPIEELERELGLTDIVKLASNENPLGPPASALEAITDAAGELARYPDGSGYQLKTALSKELGVVPEQITLGNGSNDVLDLIGRVFLEPGVSAVYSEHAFIVYPITVTATGARAIEVPAKEWGHDLEAMAAAIDSDTRVVFIANPNNPTGTWVTEKQLLAFLERVPPEVIVVLDEAYCEYVEAADHPNGISLLGQFPNLVVTRTFSKAYGLAGLRVGYGVSSPEIADYLNRIRQPFNVNSQALVAAAAALGDRDYLEKGKEVNRRGMAQLESGLSQLGLNWIPSRGNFIAFETPLDPATAYDLLLKRGVIVRPVNVYGLRQHLRVSIGLEAENARFLAALKEILEEHA